jgi:hypothetical protein
MPFDTPPSRVKKAWRMFGEGEGGAWIIGSFRSPRSRREAASPESMTTNAQSAPAVVHGFRHSLRSAGMTGRTRTCQTRAATEPRIGDRQHLEQFAHLIRRGQARQRPHDVGRLLRRGVRLQPRGALRDAEPAQETRPGRAVRAARRLRAVRTSASAAKSTCVVRSAAPGSASGSTNSCCRTACSVSPNAVATCRSR